MKKPAGYYGVNKYLEDRYSLDGIKRHAERTHIPNKAKINNLEDNRTYIINDFFGFPVHMTGKQIKTLNNYPNEQSKRSNSIR